MRTPDIILAGVHLPWCSSFAGRGGRNKHWFYCKGEDQDPACEDLMAWDHRVEWQISKRTSCCLFQFGETNPGSLFQSFGGVGRNLAGAFLTRSIVRALLQPWFNLSCFFQDCLSRLGQRPLLISATGAGPSSDAVFKHCKHMVSLHRLHEYKSCHSDSDSAPSPLSEHERRGQAKAAEHSYLLLHYCWERRNDSWTGRHGHPSADHRGICKHSGRGWFSMN